MTGVLLYEGPSLLDGAPIFVAACGRRQGRPNRKTGAAIQTYIMRSDIPPTEAAKNGQDSSVCGDCPLKPSESGVCYVQLGHGAYWTYEAYKRGVYKPFGPTSRSFFRREYLRIGTYGDPAAVPFSAWERVLSLLKNWSGYTHQWRKCDPRYRQLLMASVESPAEAEEAQKLGWRTFRLRTREQDLMPNEIMCPGSDEAGSRRQCRDCRACTGNHRSAGVGRSVAIQVHGRPWKEAQFRRLLSLPVIPNERPKMKTVASVASVLMTNGNAALLRREATFPLDSGQVSLNWSQVRVEEIDDVADWLGMMVERMKRDAKGITISREPCQAPQP